MRPERMEGKKIAVVAGTAHEAYLEAMFTEAECGPTRTPSWRAALRNREVDLLFGDGFSLAFWLNGTDSGGCCAFAAPISRAASSARASASRSNAATTPAAGHQLGPVPAGEKALHRPVAAVFPDQPVLTM